MRPDAIVLMICTVLFTDVMIFCQVDEEAKPLVSIGLSYDIAAYDDRSAPGTWTQMQAIGASLLARFSSTAFIQGALSFDTGPSQGGLSPDELLSQLYISWRPFPLLALSAGKQRLTWGCARVFYSLDRLESAPDPGDYGTSAALSGTIGLKAEMILTGELSASLFIAPETDLGWTCGALRIDALIGDIDAGFGASTFPFDKLVDCTVALPPVPRFERSRRWSFFADAAWFGDIVGFYGEAQVANARDSGWAYDNAGSAVIKNETSAETDWIFKGTLGMQADIPAWLDGTARCLLEYHYDAEGFSGGEAEDFIAAYDLIGSTGGLLYAQAGADPGSFGCNYLYAGVSGVPLTRKISVGASALVSLDSWFASSSLSLSWDAGEGVSVGLTWRNSWQWYGSAASEDSVMDSFNTISASVSVYF